MGKVTRNRFAAEFKARVALEAIKVGVHQDGPNDSF
jgi:hypothetical protein